MNGRRYSLVILILIYKSIYVIKMSRLRYVDTSEVEIL